MVKKNYKGKITKRDFDISDLKVSEDVNLMVRLKKSTFARILLWLSIKFEDSDFIYTSELAKFFHVTMARAYMVLSDFQRFGLIKKELVTSNLIMWKPIKNSKENILGKYISYAKKTLGLGK